MKYWKHNSGAENASQSGDVSLSKEDSQSQDSFPELFNTLDDFNNMWEKPTGDQPMFYNHRDDIDSHTQFIDIKKLDLKIVIYH